MSSRLWNSQTGNLVVGINALRFSLSKVSRKWKLALLTLILKKGKSLEFSLNKIRGDWSEEKLGALLDELSKGLDFDVTLTGFDIPEISEILDQLEEAKEDTFDFEGEVNKIKNPKTKPGDIIELGEHRIL